MEIPSFFFKKYALVLKINIHKNKKIVYYFEIITDYIESLISLKNQLYYDFLK